MGASTTPRPTATVTIEPMGLRAALPGDHSIHVMLDLRAGVARHADKDLVARVAHEALAGFPPAEGEPDRRRIAEVSVSRKVPKMGSTRSVVVGVEGSAVWPGRPGDEAVEILRHTLRGEGYRVAVLEKRDCAEPGCRDHVVIDWDRSAEAPAGWHSRLICGGHNYRTCSGCTSTYVLSSSNSVGPAPSVHCAVCGRVIIEWGSSKVWTAELVPEGEPASPRQGVAPA
jgi:hypothetical protein